MGLFGSKVKFWGQYFGSHPSYPDTAKTLYIEVSSKNGITLRKGFKTWGTISWREVKGFDYTGEVMNGVFKAVFTTTTGNIEVSVQSLKLSKEGDNQFRAQQLQDKLNKCKRLVIENTRAAV